jgi:hypothetical protein
VEKDGWRWHFLDGILRQGQVFIGGKINRPWTGAMRWLALLGRIPRRCGNAMISLGLLRYPDE